MCCKTYLFPILRAAAAPWPNMVIHATTPRIGRNTATGCIGNSEVCRSPSWWSKARSAQVGVSKPVPAQVAKLKKRFGLNRILVVGNRGRITEARIWEDLQEAAMDGIHVIRTSVPKEVLGDQEAVLAYKQLAKVERAFRTLKVANLQVRPIYRYLERRVKVNLFLCMLANYVKNHLRQAWKGLLCPDEEGSQRKTPVARVEPSAGGKAKKANGRSNDGFPLQTFRGIQTLATLSKAIVQLGADGPAYPGTSKMTRLQANAFELIGLNEV